MRQLVILSWLTTAFLFPQVGEMARIEVAGDRGKLIAEGARPVAAAATELARRFGMRTSVEDPAYIYQRDSVDVTALSPPGKLAQPVLVPRGARLEIPFAAMEDGTPANRVVLVDGLIEAANAALPFGYRLDVSGLPFAIVPTTTRNERGEIVAVTPLLDRVVSIPRGRRKVLESASLLAQGLSEQTGLRVSCCQSSVAGIPWGLEEADFSADNEPARDVLRRLIKLTPGRYIWLLTCEPSPSPWCFINLHPVKTTL